MSITGVEKIKRIMPEQSVILNDKNSANVKEGKFDFLVETVDYSYIGIEILTRPSRRKLNEKLVYTQQVEKFIFVLPKNSLEFYMKPKHKLFRYRWREKFFEQSFAAENIYAWIFDIGSRKFIEKDKFSNIFNVSNQ